MDKKTPIAYSQSCEAAIAALTERMEQGNISATDWEALKAEFPDCVESMNEIYEVWTQMEQLPVPEPSKAMHDRFYTMLDSYEQEVGSTSPSFFSRWGAYWQRLSGSRFSLQPAIMAILFLLGLVSGLLLRPSDSKQELQLLSTEVQQMRELTLLTLIKQSSATERLKGIHLTRQMEDPALKIVEALSQTLNQDPNVNVRLSALEALMQYSNRPLVRELLIEAIPRQTSALVQLALAEAMLQLQEAQSIDAWKQLLDSPELEPEVKEQVKTTIQTLS